MGIWKRMERRAAESEPLAVAVIGAGYVGGGVVHQLERSLGMRAALVANRTVDRAVRAYEAAGHPRESVVVSDDPDLLAEVVADRRPAVTPAADVLAEVVGLDSVVEATGALDHGAAAMLRCLSRGLDVASFNAEVDATIGWLLHHVARKHDAVYTVADGDQPGVLMRQLEFVAGMGFQVVAALNCKRNLDVHQDPDDSARYSARDKTSLLMTTAFGDGTKMQVENAVVANLTALVPDHRGMHGVQTTIAEAARDVTAVISAPGVVDFTIGGDFGAGVGVVGRAPDPGAVETSLRFLKMGEGPDYFFFRPYHLVQFEVPITIAEMALDRMALGTPVGPPVAEVITIAKRNLEPGEKLDGIGGYRCYGLIDAAQQAEGFLPIGLSGHARVTRRIPMDEPVPLDAVELDDESDIVALREHQRSLLASGAALP